MVRKQLALFLRTANPSFFEIRTGDLEVYMPRYEFYCDDCKKAFELILTLAEYEKGKVKCPKCGREHIHQEAAAFFAVTSKKS